MSPPFFWLKLSIIISRQKRNKRFLLWFLQLWFYWWSGGWDPTNWRPPLSSDEFEWSPLNYYHICASFEVVSSCDNWQIAGTQALSGEDLSFSSRLSSPCAREVIKSTWWGSFPTLEQIDWNIDRECWFGIRRIWITITFWDLSVLKKNGIWWTMPFLSYLIVFNLKPLLFVPCRSHLIFICQRLFLLPLLFLTRHCLLLFVQTNQILAMMPWPIPHRMNF